MDIYNLLRLLVAKLTWVGLGRPIDSDEPNDILSTEVTVWNNNTINHFHKNNLLFVDLKQLHKNSSLFFFKCKSYVSRT